ncbi:uncharacterized protein LOC112084465 [Eutrema salsugineum]|uniref:uncharacterized protein LOC112084465 n=1 Tax=Eutrema salsugineum TaxID=72664 RepID=UPI000CECEC3A|nr:uncharacterized protein LOC112084465 [Eutrema salsugineum]
MFRKQIRVEDAKLLAVQVIDADQSEVIGTTSAHVVNLKEKTCTCRRFDLDKIPCVHVIAAAEARKTSRISLCHPYYQTNYLQHAYAGSVMPRDIALPVPEEVANKICHPPFVRHPPGRPKKTRIKSAFEIATANKRSRQMPKCSTCGKSGHNRITCKA